MGIFLKHIVYGLIGLHLFFFTEAFAKKNDAKKEIQDVSMIAEKIRRIDSSLSLVQYFEYAQAIYLASQRYGIDPSVLITVTNHESKFREKNSEGKSGEIGICQIRKSWLKDVRFRKEFGNVTLKDLRKPVHGFLYAAWILSDIKKKTKNQLLPYWTYYNSKRYEKFLSSSKRTTGNASPKLLESIQTETSIAEASRPDSLLPAVGNSDYVRTVSSAGDTGTALAATSTDTWKDPLEEMDSSGINKQSSAVELLK